MRCKPSVPLILWPPLDANKQSPGTVLERSTTTTITTTIATSTTDGDGAPPRQTTQMTLSRFPPQGFSHRQLGARKTSFWPLVLRRIANTFATTRRVSTRSWCWSVGVPWHDCCFVLCWRTDHAATPSFPQQSSRCYRWSRHRDAAPTSRCHWRFLRWVAWPSNSSPSSWCRCSTARWKRLSCAVPPLRSCDGGAAEHGLLPITSNPSRSFS